MGSNLGISYGGDIQSYGRLPWRVSDYGGKGPFIYVGDFDGDGKADIIFYEGGSNLGISYGSDNLSTYNRLSWTVSDNGQGPFIWVGDFNGDGKSDILFFESGLDLGISYGGNLNTYGRLSYHLNQPWIWVGDFNGDGASDILFYEQGYDLGISYGNNLNSYGRLSWGVSQPTLWVGDFNGDGRSDILFYEAGTNLGISYGGNLNSYGRLSYAISGNGTIGPQVWVGDFDGDKLSDILFYENGQNLGIAYGYNLNSYNRLPWAPSNNNGRGPDMRVGDFNGDAKSDVIFHEINLPLGISWAYPMAPDLLSLVTTNIGGSFNMTYTPSSSYTNTLLPFVTQTLSSVSASDGRGNVSTTTYNYEGGLFDYADRELRGFRKVTAYKMRDSQYYESMGETTFHQDAVLKGLSETEIITSYEGHKRQTDHLRVAIPTPGGGNFPALTQITASNTDIVTGIGPVTYSRVTTYAYDDYFNVTEEHKYGLTSEEEVHTYFNGWVLGKPSDISVRNASGEIVSRKWLDYNPNTGNLLAEEVCKSDTPNTGCLSRNATQNPVITYSYYTEGTLYTTTDPRGTTTSRTYDSTKTYAYETTNALGHKTTTEYDVGTGKLKRLTPPHLQGTTYAVNNTYDQLGRKIREDRPDGGWTGYSYVNFGSPSSQYIQTTEHITGGYLDLDQVTQNYFDGLGRNFVICASGPDQKWINIVTLYDSLGRVWAKSNPYFSGEMAYYTSFGYDGFSRQIDVLAPDGNHIIANYKGLDKTVTDQNGHTTTYTYDIYSRLKRVSDPNQTITEYSYDTLGNLIQVIAAQGTPEQNITTMTYDSLSKKRTMNDPNTGYWTYIYDKNGNLISQSNTKSSEDLDANSRVQYTYDDPSVPYSKGKIT